MPQTPLVSTHVGSYFLIMLLMASPLSIARLRCNTELPGCLKQREFSALRAEDRSALHASVHYLARYWPLHFEFASYATINGVIQTMTFPTSLSPAPTSTGLSAKRDCWGDIMKLRNDLLMPCTISLVSKEVTWDDCESQNAGPRNGTQKIVVTYIQLNTTHIVAAISKKLE